MLRLSKQSFGSAEASVIRGYLDTCLEMPWNKKTRETLDIGKARRILDADHYGSAGSRIALLNSSPSAGLRRM